MEGYVGAKNEECFMADKTWKYARVPKIKNVTIISMGEKAARKARGCKMARMTGSQ